jgi:acetyl-CoA carboxylase biotin carboxyl carrier protein
MASFDIDGDLIRKLAGLLEETGLTEIEFSEKDRRIRVTRGGGPAAYAAINAPSLPAPVAVAAPAAPVAAGDHPGAVTSPMVGTAYLAAEPGGIPFVRVGDSVRAGQTVVIIEAMKVMNPIKAPRSGVVMQILVGDAQPVEFGEVLMIVE